MYFLCSFSKFLRYFINILYIYTSKSKILAAGLERTIIRLYFCDFTLFAPPSPNKNLILFDFHSTSVKLFNQKLGPHNMIILLNLL